MRIEQNYSLEKHNTFHLPVKTRWFMEYETEEELQRILHDEYFQECLSLHIRGRAVYDLGAAHPQHL